VSSALFTRSRVALAALVLLLPLGSVRADEPLRDPTRPPPAVAVPEVADAKPESNDLDLRAIFFSGDRRSALINGRRVGEADRIAGGEVLAIEADRVRVQQGAETLELVLVSPAFKDARASELPARLEPVPIEAPVASAPPAAPALEATSDSTIDPDDQGATQ
jgi:hypothetical protein